MEMALCTYCKRTILEDRDVHDEVQVVSPDNSYAEYYGKVPLANFLKRTRHEEDFHTLVGRLGWTDAREDGLMYVKKLPSITGIEQYHAEILPIVENTFSKIVEICKQLKMYT